MRMKKMVLRVRMVMVRMVMMRMVMVRIVMVMVRMVRMVRVRMKAVTSQERYATPPSCAVEIESMLGLKKGSLSPRKSWMLSLDLVRVVEFSIKRSRSRMGKSNHFP